MDNYRYHDFRLLATHFDIPETETFRYNIIQKYDDVREGTKLNYDYSIYSRKNSYIAYGSYFSFEDDFFERQEATETVLSFDKDGFLEHVFKIKHSFHSSGETYVYVTQLTLPTKKQLAKFQKSWRRRNIDFDPVEMRILSWKA
jgi:hypothetical protein